MTAFAAAVDALFRDPHLTEPALYRAGGSGDGVPVRIARRAPDVLTPWGEARIVSDTTLVEVRVSDLPEPRPGDLIVLGAESFLIQGEPLRDRDRLIWTIDLRPE